MTNDFFLVERAAQIQRLGAARSGNRIEIPAKLSRLGLSKQTKQLFGTIDRICRIPLGDKKAKWLEWLAARGGRLIGLRSSGEQSGDEDDPPLLSQAHRVLLNAFEQQIVELKVGDDVDASTAAEAIIMAILQDHHSFTGLKPLQLHSDNFAYECLFPSWLNLYTALVLRHSESSEPRFSHDQIKTIFRFLTEFAEGGETPDAELVGACTLTANRLPPSEAHPLIQRMMDLCCLESRCSIAASDERMGSIREQTTSAAEFLGLLKNLTIFETSAFSDQIVSKFQIGSELPSYEALPPSLAKRVQALEGEGGEFAVWAELVRQIGQIVDDGGCIDGDFADVLEQRTDGLGDWIALLTLGENAVPLSRMCQRLLARMIRRSEAAPNGLEMSTIQVFARIIAPRLDVLNKPMVSYFEKEFIDQDKNRRLLLRCAEDNARRREIARQLITRAQKSEEHTRLLSQLAIAAILDPDYTSSKLAGIRRTVSVLGIMRDQGFISSNQLEDLASDIRQRLPGSMEFLVTPFMGASEQEGRLAKLYLALYEECEKYEHYGEAGNFGLTSAAYGNLNRAIDRET